MAVKANKEQTRLHITNALNAANELKGMDEFVESEFNNSFTRKYNGYVPNWGYINIYWDFKNSKFLGYGVFGKTIYLGKINPRTMKKSAWVDALASMDMDKIYAQLKEYVKDKVAKNRRALVTIHNGSPIDKVQIDELSAIGSAYNYATNGCIQPESVPDDVIKGEVEYYLLNSDVEESNNPFYQWDAFKDKVQEVEGRVLAAFDEGNMYGYFSTRRLNNYVDRVIKKKRGEQAWFHQFLELGKVEGFSYFHNIIESHKNITVTDRVLDLIADKFDEWFDRDSSASENIHKMIELRKDSFAGKVLVADNMVINQKFKGDCIYVGMSMRIGGVEPTFDPHKLKYLQDLSRIHGVNVWYTDAVVKQAQTFYSLLGAESPTLSIPDARIIKFDRELIKLFGRIESQSSNHRNWLSKDTLASNYGLV